MTLQNWADSLTEEQKWKEYAQGVGERLTDNGPANYYLMTADEWWAWFLSLDIQRRLNPQRDDNGPR